MTAEQTILVADVFTPMDKVLDSVGWYYRGIPGQTACPVHKGGTETTASARLYEDGLYCYTCAKQYRPTEIYAAVHRMDRLSAAEKMLALWPIPEDKAQNLIRNYTAPKQKSVSQAVLDIAESYLLSYKHKVPLAVYREWTEKVDKLSETLLGE
jgi:hypothetical protein